MRWNCPHCEELVTAGIDFETTQKAYVRCKKCNGMAIIHRSAALADFVKARRTEEEALLNAEIKISEAKAEFARELEKLKSIAQPEITVTHAPSHSISSSSMGMEMISPESPRTPTPPPFRGPKTDVAAAAPIFSYPKPPAFLLKNSAQEKPVKPQKALESTQTKNSKFAHLAIWIAASLAIASGAYLFIQGRKALSNSEATVKNSTADHILSNSSSTTRSIGIVRVPRAVIRSLPSISGTALSTLDQSQPLNVFEEKDGWIRVESPKIKTNSNSAWVRTDLITRVPN